jgi:hypothetical protein
MCVSHAHDRLSLHAVSRLFGAFPAFDQGSVIGANDPSLRSVADRRMRLVQRLGRAGLAACAELVVWVQSDRDEARRRGLTRDVELGRSSEEAAAFWDEWMQAEEPFLAADWPWSRTSLVVNGTPPEEMRTRTFLARGPLSHRFAAHVVPLAAPKNRCSRPCQRHRPAVAVRRSPGG